MKASRFPWCVPFLLPAGLLFSQATDFIDTSDLAGRAIAFETEGTVRFGVWDLRTVGDVNGDGASDIGLVHTASRDPYVASVYLIFGGPGWGERNIIRPELENSARFWEDPPTSGYEIAEVGDLNADGYAEFAFSAWGYRPTASPDVRGALFIIHGEPGFAHSGELREITGRIPGTIVYDTTPDVRLLEGSGLVDLNGDGRRDLILTALLHPRTTPSGFLYVLLDLRDLGPRVDLKDIGKTLPGADLHTPDFEGTLADAGDFDGDGFHDLLISNDSEVIASSVFLFYGRADLQGPYNLRALADLGEEVHQFLRPAAPEDLEGLQFGQDGQQAGVGDINGDGFDDIVMGESYLGFNSLAGAGVGDGRVHLIYGGLRVSGLEPTAVDELPADRRRVFHGLGEFDSRDAFAGNVAGPGDINGDAIPDLLVSAARRREDSAGEAYLIHGRRELPADVYLAAGFDGIRIAGDTASGFLGAFLGPAGDFNADGNPDFLIGEPHATPAVPGTSKAFVVLGTGNGLPPLTVVAVEPRSGFVRGGTRVRLRGSGFEDGARVNFGAAPARILERVSASELLVESPRGPAPGEVDVTVTVGATTRTARDRFEYVPDRPELDLQNPGRWGLRVDGFPGFSVGLGLDFADLDGDGIDDLLVGSNLGFDWVVTVVRGGRSLPQAMGAVTPGPEKSLIFKRAELDENALRVTVRNVGDVNGDGIADLAVARLGSSYLFFGRRDLAAELDFDAEVEAGRAVRLRFDATASSRVDFAPLGDLTGDGIGDLGISISADSVLLVAGKRDWPAEVDIHDPINFFSRLHGTSGRFALFFAQAGDVNGDGHPDLLVNGGEGERTVAYLVYTLGSPLQLARDAQLEEYVLAGGGAIFEWTDNMGGIYVSGAGDVNGDGIDDFLLGDERGTVGVPYEGISYLVYGRREFPVRISFPNDLSPIELDGVVRLGGRQLKQAGRVLAPAGDYTGDGFADFIVRSVNSQFVGSSPPHPVHVIFGGPDLPAFIDLVNPGRHGFRIDGIHPDTSLEETTRTAGDLNGDGALDFAFSESPEAVHVIFGLPPRVSFIRGDANDDGGLNLTDAVFALNYLFLGGVDPHCEDAADADDRGTIGLTDAVYILNHLYLGGPQPPAPYPGPGDDPTDDGLGCRGF